MTRVGWSLRFVLSAAIALICGPAVAQTDFNLRSPGGQRPFADPLYWLNLTPDARLPIRERLMRPQVGMNALAPPSPRRSGFTPWIGMSYETLDRAGTSDSQITFAPGFQFLHDGPRLRFQAEYALEAAAHARPELSRLVQSHGGYANLTYALDPRSQVSLFNLFSDTRDTREAIVQGAVAGATRLTSNALIAGYRFSPSRRERLDLTYRNTQYRLDLATLADVGENSLAARYEFALSPVASVAGFVDAGRFDLGPRTNATRLFAGATYTRDLGPRLAASGTLGVLHTSQAGGHTEFAFGGTVTATDRFARYSLTVGRDIIAVPGIASLARSDDVTGTALLRLGDGLKLELGLSHQTLSFYDPGQARTSVLSAKGTLSYAVSRDLWLSAGLDLSQERSGGVTTRENRLVLGLSRSFAP